MSADRSTALRSRLSRLLLIVALALAAAQLVWPSIVTPLAIDEQVSYYVACGKTPETVFERALEQSATPPFYFWLVNGSMRLGSLVRHQPSPEFWMRLPSLLALVSSLCVLYWISEGILGNGTGGAAALLLACHPTVVEYALLARPYLFGLLLNLVAIGCLFRLRGFGWRWHHLAGFLAANIGLFWTHYLFAILPVAQLAVLTLATWPAERSLAPQSRRPLSLGLLALLIVFTPMGAIPLAPGILRLSQLGDYLNWITEVPAWHRPLELLRWRMALVLFVIAVAVGIAYRLLQQQAPRHNETDSPLDSEQRGPVRTLFAFALWFAIPIAILWTLGHLKSASLAQERYIVMQAGPAVLLIVGLLRSVAPPSAVAVLAACFVIADGASQRIGEIIKQPVRHDSYWLDATRILNDQASDMDVALVYTGLVETALVPALYSDPGFQEYTSSRISDFYLRVPIKRLSLPLRWTGGDWQQNYEKPISTARANGGRIWLLVSADSDWAQSVEQATRDWLATVSLRPTLVNNERVAKLYRME